MQENTGTLKWVALTLFAGLLMVAIMYPKFEKGVDFTSTKFETVTTGGDHTPPASWTPNK